jgi:molybdopterin-guanine dinucleotide biosynthesis protein A
MTDVAVTLGILAGGRATRLGGLDKAWLERDGKPQVLRIAQRFAARVDRTLVSANGDQQRYRRHGLTAIADSFENIGPIGGLQALVAACETPWLLTIPVDVVDVNDCLLPTLLAHADGRGAYAIDEDGVQPLVALWRVGVANQAIADAIAQRQYGMHPLLASLKMSGVNLPGVRFGNLNTPTDLLAARVEPTS